MYFDDNNDRFNEFNNDIDLNNFEKIEKIGKGQFSTVYKVKNKIDGCTYAMKVIEKNPESQKDIQLKQLRREIENLLKCFSINNCGVVLLLGYKETKEKYILIFEYCNTNLEQYIEKNYSNKKLKLDEIKLLFLDLNEGFRHLYENNIIHRDIKINNILIKYRFNDKNDIIPLLADFGISRDNSLDNPMTSNISWALLSAPEILENGNDYSFASDLWSIGILLYKLAFGKYPFEGKGIIQVYNNIMNSPNLEESGDKNFDDLIRNLLNKNKKRRITYEQYFSHPFFKFDEPQSLIDFNEKYNLHISSYNKKFFLIGYLDGNKILKDLSNVEFNNLKELHLENCNIKNITPLQSEQFSNMLLLNLQYNNISNLYPFKDAKFLNIKQIHLGFNYITNIAALEGIPFKQLQVITFTGNHNLHFDEEFKRIYKKLINK